MTIIEKINKNFYKNYRDNWDDKLFRNEILKRIDSEYIILDLAAGAGIVEEMNFKNIAKEVHGIDLDKRVLENKYLDFPVIGNCENLPYEDNKFDLIFSDNLLEHLEHPKIVFSEIERVLKNDGIFIFKTPNKYHYMPLISHFTPHSFHRWYNNLRGRDYDDTFPTFYRANSRGNIKRLINNLSLKISKISLIEGRPEYLKIYPFLYLLGLVYERIVNSISLFSFARILLIGELTKYKK